MIKRFILWLIRVVASIAVLVGIFLIICGALGLGNTLIPGIIVLVIALIVNSSTLKKSEKATTEDRQKCKKCGGSLVGAAYKYNSRLKIEKELGCNYVQVPVTVTCPHCGKSRIIVETVYCYEGESIEKIQQDLDNKLEEYYG